MLCLRRPRIYMLWSVCHAASHLQHLTASFDSFAGALSAAAASKMTQRVMESLTSRASPLAVRGQPRTTKAFVASR
jgi:hypothetical protein